MYVFWDFAFPPSPRPAWGPREFGGIVLEVFVNPLNLVAPVFPASCVALPLLPPAPRRNVDPPRSADPPDADVPDRAGSGAAAARRYPFHGRLILALVPAFYLLLA